VLRACGGRVCGGGIPPAGLTARRAGQIGAALALALVDRGARRGHVCARPDNGGFLPFFGSGSSEVGAAGSARLLEAQGNRPFPADRRKPVRLTDARHPSAAAAAEGGEGAAPLFGRRSEPMPVAYAPTGILGPEAPSRVSEAKRLAKNREFFKPKTGSGVARHEAQSRSARQWQARRDSGRIGAGAAAISENRGHGHRLGGGSGDVN
jgi:hypothetical protein